MRLLAVLLAIASACDLQPPPKKAPAAAPPTPAAVVTPSTPEPALPALDAGVVGVVGDAAAAPMEVSDRCVQLGSHVAEVLINEAEDPSKKSVLVQDRTKIVRRTAESCTRDGWDDKLISCYMAAKTQATLQACRKPDIRPPAPPTPDGPTPR